MIVFCNSCGWWHFFLSQCLISIKERWLFKHSCLARCSPGIRPTLIRHVCCIQSSGRTFDCNRFHQAVDRLILDFILLASLHLGRPAPQHAHYWLTLRLTGVLIGQQPPHPCDLSQAMIGWLKRSLESSHQDGLNESRCGLSRSTVHAFPGRHEVRRDGAPQHDPGCADAGRAFGRQQHYSQGLSPKGTLCGPLVVTVLQAAWCGHVCHIPPCHPTRRRAVSWLSSCHTWMMLLRLRVWQWLALVTITIRTSLLIHLVQKVRVLEIGRHLIFPLPLLSPPGHLLQRSVYMFLSSAFSLEHVNHSVRSHFMTPPHMYVC